MDLLNFTIDLARKAGDLVYEMREIGVEVKEKVENDFVTLADKESEKLIVSKVLKNFPEHKILAEEDFFEKTNDYNDYCNETEYLWVIDPIDGTTNYTRKMPFYCVSIGLLNVISGGVELGVVYAPALRELFYAEKGQGAFLLTDINDNDFDFKKSKKLKISKIQKLKKAILATGFPPQHKERNLEYFSKVVPLSKSIRRCGSAALDLCYLAAGRLDGFWEFGLKPWDVAAGGLIALEAGAKIGKVNGDLEENKFDIFAHDILASSPKIYDEFKKNLVS